MQLDVIGEHIADDDALVARLDGCEIVVAMRERTPFGRRRLERLPALRLLVTTGRANAAIDLAAARELGIIVCGTDGLGRPHAELTWALILAARATSAPRTRRCAWAAGSTRSAPSLEGRTLGIIGLGPARRRGSPAIGRAFGMDVIAWSQNLRGAGCRRPAACAPVEPGRAAGAADVRDHPSAPEPTARAG